MLCLPPHAFETYVHICHKRAVMATNLKIKGAKLEDNILITF